MLAPVSVGLKFGFLIVLYLFLLWVAWSAMRDLRRGRGGVVAGRRRRPYDATGMYPASSGLGDHDSDGFEPRLLVERAPGHETGSAYELPNRALRSAAETSRSGSTIRSPPRITPASRGKATSS